MFFLKELQLSVCYGFTHSLFPLEKPGDQFPMKIWKNLAFLLHLKEDTCLVFRYSPFSLLLYKIFEPYAYRIVYVYAKISIGNALLHKSC